MSPRNDDHLLARVAIVTPGLVPALAWLIRVANGGEVDLDQRPPG